MAPADTSPVSSLRFCPKTAMSALVRTYVRKNVMLMTATAATAEKSCAPTPRLKSMFAIRVPAMTPVSSTRARPKPNTCTEVNWKRLATSLRMTHTRISNSVYPAETTEKDSAMLVPERGIRANPTMQTKAVGL